MNVYYPLAHRFYKGEATSKNLSLFLPFDISPKQFINILLGKSAIYLFSIEDIRYTQEKGKYKIELISFSEKKKQTLWVDPKKDTITTIELIDYEDNRISFFEFKKFKKIQGFLMPQQIKIKVSSQIEIFIKYKDIAILESVENTLFELPIQDELIILE